MQRPGKLWLGLALVLSLTVGCELGQVAEVPLAPEALLPPGSDERKVPTILFESLGIQFTASSQGWARGFWSSDDWQATVNYVEAAAKANGYAAAPVPMLTSVDAEGLDTADYIRDYTSPGQTIELLLINLDVMRKRGTQYDTSAKYVLLTGNRVELQAQIAEHGRQQAQPGQ